MDFIEAVELIKKGRKVRLPNWDSNTYLYNRGIFVANNPDNSAYLDEELGQWEEYIEGESLVELHTFPEVLNALRKGKTIKRDSVPLKYSAGSSSNPTFKIHDVLANDWVILENKEED